MLLDLILGALLMIGLCAAPFVLLWWADGFGR